MNEWEWQLLEERTPIALLAIGGSEVKVGDRIRLRPKPGGDVLDIALAGQIAVIESIEQDYEGKVHVCVVLESDPGRDLGLLRQPGHRFFFDAAEIEPLPAEEVHAAPQAATQPARILIAGIGNIFLGDDGFGVEVVKRLARRELPARVRLADFGIRGLDLTYALQDGYETTILVDAYPHGKEPGAVSLIEPDLSQLGTQPCVETHEMNPIKVLRMAAAMSGSLNKILLVGCEPASFGGDEGQIGLSEPVDTAVEEAVKMILDTVSRILEPRN